MTTEKRGRAINGDLFTVQHPSISLAAPFTTFIDVSFRGTTHQVLAARNRGAFNFANTTGEFSVAGLSGYVIETLDTVETQATHRYQAVVEAEAGVLSTHSYDSIDTLLSLVGSLRPSPTSLGIALDPNDEIEYTTAPRVAMELGGASDTPAGMIEITPLTAEVIDQLPSWQGTSVTAGQLYGGRFTDEAVYLTLVTETCRMLAMPHGVDEDQFTTTIAALQVNWHS